MGPSLRWGDGLGGPQSSFFPRLSELLQHHVPLQLRQVIDEEDALQMVHLMLEADRQQPFEVLFMLLPMLVEPTSADAVRPHHFGILVGH